jgi:hypothetical protein
VEKLFVAGNAAEIVDRSGLASKPHAGLSHQSR